MGQERDFAATRGLGVRRLILLGFPPERSEELATAFPARIDILIVKDSETLTEQMVTSSNVALIWVGDQVNLVTRIDAIAKDMTLPLPIVVTGSVEGCDRVRKDFPDVRVFEELNVPYVLGLLDSALMNREKVRSFGKAQDRVQALYEVSSELLKVTSRKEIHEALDKTLAHVLPFHLCLISLPDDPNPLVYFRSREILTIPQVEVLYGHVYGAWEVLRPNRKNSWDWLFDLAGGEREPSGQIYPEKHFISAPLTHEKETRGFITVLPERAGQFSETRLQTLFVVGDLISVLLNNISLREQLEARATHDGLTGLLNRQTLMEQLEKECSRTARYQTPLSIIMLDLDFFKKVNDTYGHQAGDEVLRYVSRRLARSLRQSDSVGRCGGEEFIVLLPGTDLDGAAIWAERFRRRLASTPLQYGNHSITITVSAGVSTSFSDACDTDMLIANADRGLYASKHRGRNTVSIVDKCGGEPVPFVEGE